MLFDCTLCDECLMELLTEATMTVERAWRCARDRGLVPDPLELRA